MGLGEISLGEMGLGEMGQNPSVNSMYAKTRHMRRLEFDTHGSNALSWLISK